MRIATGRRRRSRTRREDARWVERVDANVAVDAFDPPWWRRRNALDPANRPGRSTSGECLFVGGAARGGRALHSRSLPLATDVNLAVVARDARVLGRGSRGSVPRAAMASIRRAAADGAADDGDASSTEMRVTARDFADAAVAWARPWFAAWRRASPTTWDDIGGLEDVKRRLRRAVERPLRHAEAFAGGPSPPRGILLHGPPGCAKTTMARAAAAASGATTVTLAAADVFSCTSARENGSFGTPSRARTRRRRCCSSTIDGMVGSRGAGQGDASDVGAHPFGARRDGRVRAGRKRCAGGGDQQTGRWTPR